MKRFLLIVAILFVSYTSIAQVGINNTDPKASLDITATNAASPSNTDGLLIPRIDVFPTTDPTTDQHGMMVYLTTTSAGNPPGFYYWDDNAGPASWVNVVKDSDHDWYEIGTTNSPNNISDDIFTQGNVAIGTDTPVNTPLYVKATSSSGGITLNKYSKNTSSGIDSGITSFTNLESGSYGPYYNVSSPVQSLDNVSGLIYNYHAKNNVKTLNSSDSHYLYYGIFSYNTGYNANAKRYGSYIEYTTNTTSRGDKYGHYTTIPSTVPGTHYGVYSDVTNTSGYAGYFLGRVSFGTTNANKYIFPSSRGTNNQLLQTDASGSLSWEDPSTVFSDTDNQTIDVLNFNGTDLEISLEDDGVATQTVDLSSLQDGTGSDDQNIQGLSFNSSTNILTVGIEDGTSDTVSLMPLRSEWTDYGTFLSPTEGDNINLGSTTAGTGNLNISRNSGPNSPQIQLTENQSNGGARINFTNLYETDNLWTLYARTDNTIADSRFNIYHTTTGDILRILGDGKVGIMRTPTTNAFEVNGTASKSSSGSWLGNSDRRLKKEITTIEGVTALSKINQLRGVTYKWNDQTTGINRPEGIQYGFIAQELMNVFPEKVTKDNLGYYQTAYGDYDALFVQAIKELNNKVEILETENQELKGTLSKYKDLEKRLSLLENNSKPSIDLAKQ